MPRFLVVIPEVREEIVDVEYEIEAENKEEVQDLIDDYRFLENAEYLETKESKWGFEVKDTFFEKSVITELKNA